MIFLELFWAFFQIGLFTFGGGYAMIPLIQDAVISHGWLTGEALVNFIAIAESTPGPFAVNIATYVGTEMGQTAGGLGMWGGLLGGCCATLGVVLPSFIIIYLISMFLDNFLEITLIANAFQGIKIAVGILIVNAGLNMLKKLPKNVLSRTILVCSLCAMLAIDMFSLRFSTITLMLAAGVVGICATAIKKGGEPA
jgi:chromate transporter